VKKNLIAIGDAMTNDQISFEITVSSLELGIVHRDLATAMIVRKSKKCGSRASGNIEFYEVSISLERGDTNTNSRNYCIDSYFNENKC